MTMLQKLQVEFGEEYVVERIEQLYAYDVSKPGSNHHYMVSDEMLYRYRGPLKDIADHVRKVLGKQSWPPA